MPIEMTIHGFTLDTLTQKPVLLLKNKKEDFTLPIWISSAEAVSIAAELVTRDLTAQSGRRELLSLLLNHTGMSVTRITLDSVNDGIFMASLWLSHEGNEQRVEVRGGDAIVASLKFHLPIVVAEEVVAQASTLALSDEAVAREHDARRFVDYLDNLNPGDLGKYPM